jgi:hypothetical protein
MMEKGKFEIIIAAVLIAIQEIIDEIFRRRGGKHEK